MPSVAVVILNYNGEALLRQFLPSVIQYSGDASIIVADNASTDQSLSLLRTYFPAVKVITLTENFGFCGGYNRALKQVEADYYVLLNSDVEVTPDWLTPMIQLLDNHAEIAAVQPKILSYHQRNKFEYAGAGGGFLDCLGYPYCRGRIFNYTEIDSGQYDDTREIFWATGACLCIRAELFHQQGGFDESFFAHMEEIDLCWKLIRSGHRIYYTGQSTVFHVGAGTLSKTNPKKTYYNFRNGLTLLLKHLPLSQLIIKLPIRYFLDLMAAVKFLLEGHPRDATAVVSAHYAALSELSETLKKRRKYKKHSPFSTTQLTRRLLPFDYYILGRRTLNQ